MRLDILLEPPGAEADCVMAEWLKATGLIVAMGQVEVSSDRCLDVLVALRSRCYDRELTVNVKFTDKED
ncbi:MAG: hypothetical protein ABFS18_06600 [Thermodesulfobacteriota bacterium]